VLTVLKLVCVVDHLPCTDLEIADEMIMTDTNIVTLQSNVRIDENFGGIHLKFDSAQC